MFGDVRYKIDPVELQPDVADLAPGQVELRDGKVLVGTGSHAVLLRTLQESGRNSVAAKAWLNNQSSAVIFA